MEKERYKLLIVEDEESLRLIYEEYLGGKAQFDVITANDGESALDLISKNLDTDLILLDLVLPKKDGLEVLRSIKSNPKTKNIRVYLLTQLKSDDVIKKGFELGADGYLIKDTMYPDELEKEIMSALKAGKA